MSTAPSVPAAEYDDSSSAAPPGAEIRETHTGVVVLFGDRAYKVKKPIRTDFLDFRAVETRERICAREVTLNQRLAPGAYLGVGHYAGPREGDPGEPVIVMRRYPDHRRLAVLVESDECVEQQLLTVAELLAGFHSRTTRSPSVDADATPEVLARRWTENLDVLKDYAGSVLPEERVADVRRLALKYLAGRRDLLSARIMAGRIVDGHGDLSADDVFCMPEGPVLLDCLEFDDHLRHVDGIDDAAFLAMDLEYRGHAALAIAFLDHYRHAARDSAPQSLVHLYIAYRALVRAKVDCIRVDQGAESAAADARRHLYLALTHLRRGSVQAVLVGGGPGSGKTTLARALVPHLDAVVISTDDVRHQLLQEHQIRGAPGTFNGGRYDKTSVDAVYDAVMRRASETLAAGRSVILDGTWSDPAHRARAHDMASQRHSPLVELTCEVDVEQALERIRRRGDGTRSEVTPDIARTMYRDHARFSTANRIDTTQPLGDSVAEAVAICCLAV